MTAIRPSRGDGEHAVAEVPDQVAVEAVGATTAAAGASAVRLRRAWRRGRPCRRDGSARVVSGTWDQR